MIHLRARSHSASRQVKPSSAGSQPRLSASEQTRLSWAKAVNSYAEVPEVFKPFFEPYASSQRGFPYTVLTPSLQILTHSTVEKLISDLGGEIAILERSGSAYEAQRFPLDGISYVEVTIVLLDSRIKITGVTKQGVNASTTVRFNSVTDYLMAPILERMRLGEDASAQGAPRSEMDKFDGWAKLNFKFMNFARGSLLGGENVMHAVLQPEVRVRRIGLMGMSFYQTVAPALAVILTDRELITIRDDLHKYGANRYGGIWDYIPLDKIAAASLSEKDTGLLALSIALPEGARLEYLFQAAARPELEALLDGLREAAVCIR
jgi:hypothetical protein